MAPRIPPLTFDELPDDIRPQVESARDAVGGALNLFLTFGRHPGLLRRYLPFGGKVLNGSTLPARERELVVLRVGWLCASEYEWGQHVRIGQAAGLSDDEVDRVPKGPEAEGWSPLEALVLRAADEQVTGHRIDDDTWAALADHLDTRQLIDLSVLIGAYVMVAGLLNSLGVEREPGVPGLPS